MIVTELLGSMNDEAGRALVGRQPFVSVALDAPDPAVALPALRH